MLERFWCPDVADAAAAVRSRCPEDAQRCISIADDVLENRFLFRDHWEMERTYEPVQFGPAESDIDWACVPAGDPEWLYAMNRHTSFVNLGKAWQYTRDIRYAEKWARLIEDWIDRIPLTEESEANTWRSLEAGLRCEYWLRSVKLVQDSGVLTSQLRKKIDGCLHTHGEYLVRKSGEFQKISNWGVLQDHGLLLLGVYLERPEWTALALKRLDENLHRSVMADGSQWEQSPMYHCEVLHNAADALLVARQNKVEVPVRFEENVHKMFRALAAWTKPNGNLPCQSDSDDADARDILAMGALLFEDPVLRTASGADPLEENYWDFGPACGVRLASLEIIADECPSDALPDSGNYMLHCLGDVACELFRAPYSTDYNSLKEGDALLVKCRGEKFTSMVAVLDLAADSPLCAELIPVTRTDGEPLTVPAQAVRIVRDGTETVVLERHGDMPTPVGLLQAGRFSGHGRTIVFSDVQPDGIVLDW